MRISMQPAALWCLAALPMYSQAFDCNANQTIRSNGDIKPIQDCSTFKGDIILSGDLAENITLNHIHWGGNNSITNTDCGGDGFCFENVTVSCDAKTLWNLQIVHGPLYSIEMPQLESANLVKVGGTGLRELLLPKLKYADRFELFDDVLLKNVSVADGFHAATPKLFSGHGLSINMVPTPDFNQFLSTESPCGDISVKVLPAAYSVKDEKPLIFDLTLRNTGSIYLDGFGSNLRGKLTLQAANTDEQTSSRGITLESFDSITIADGSREKLRRHQPGDLKLQYYGGEVLPIPFHNITSLDIRDSDKLNHIDARVEDWANWELNDLKLMHNPELEKLGPRLLPEDLNAKEPPAYFYWPYANLTNVEIRGNLQPDFFDSFIHPENFSNDTKWKRENRPWVFYMIVESTMSNFSCDGLLSLLDEPRVILDSLTCQGQEHKVKRSMGIRVQFGYTHALVILAAMFLVL